MLSAGEARVNRSNADTDGIANVIIANVRRDANEAGGQMSCVGDFVPVPNKGGIIWTGDDVKVLSNIVNGFDDKVRLGRGTGSMCARKNEAGYNAWIADELSATTFLGIEDGGRVFINHCEKTLSDAGLEDVDEKCEVLIDLYERMSGDSIPWFEIGMAIAGFITLCIGFGIFVPRLQRRWGGGNDDNNSQPPSGGGGGSSVNDIIQAYNQGLADAASGTSQSPNIGSEMSAVEYLGQGIGDFFADVWSEVEANFEPAFNIIKELGDWTNYSYEDLLNSSGVSKQLDLILKAKELPRILSQLPKLSEKEIRADLMKIGFAVYPSSNYDTIQELFETTHTGIPGSTYLNSLFYQMMREYVDQYLTSASIPDMEGITQSAVRISAAFGRMLDSLGQYGVSGYQLRKNFGAYKKSSYAEPNSDFYGPYAVPSTFAPGTYFGELPSFNLNLRIPMPNFVTAIP